MKEGYPVEKLYKNEVKPIDSHRFEFITPRKIKNTIKIINENIKQRRLKSQDPILRSGNVSIKESNRLLPESFFDDDSESQALNKSHDIVMNLSVDLNGSYEPITQGPAQPAKIPGSIPCLNFHKLDEYNRAVKKAKQNAKAEQLKVPADVMDEIDSVLTSS
mmetsp:Transcript_37511/g.43114  ORF Transcript_37511/g.43114 Transcript_37511/m.43114 type:complete len:162 (+) Transcript_37511:924-1409(+)